MGAAVVHDLRRRIGWAALPVTSSDIKNSDAAQMLPMMWTTAADRFRNRPPPELQNTDRDRLVLIEDEFALRSADRPAVLAALDNAGFARDQDDDGASLGGRTPRQVAKAGASTERRELDLLLKEAEFSEGRQDAEQRFDIGSIRAELGL